MKKYSVRYLDKEGDSTKVWVEADSIEQAKQEVKREYWDIETIISVTPM